MASTAAEDEVVLKKGERKSTRESKASSSSPTPTPTPLERLPLLADSIYTSQACTSGKKVIYNIEKKKKKKKSVLNVDVR